MDGREFTCDVCEEVLDELWNGTVVKLTDSDQLRVLTPGARECDRAIRCGDWKHQERCPDCLETVAENMFTDADSYREAGNERAAFGLEMEAAELLSGAAKIRRRASARGREGGSKSAQLTKRTTADV